MKKYPWFKMWPSLWLSDPHLKHCKWDAKGLLTDLMCIAHHGTPRGTVTNGGVPLTVRDIAKTFSESFKKTSRLMQVLLDLNRIGFTSASLCSQSESKQKNTVDQKEGIWFIPSMVRETEQAEKASKDGLKGWHAKQQKTLYHAPKPPLNPEEEAEADKDVDVEGGHTPSDPPGVVKPGASGREERPRRKSAQEQIDELHESEKRKAREASGALSGPTGTPESSVASATTSPPDKKEPPEAQAPDGPPDTSPGMGLV